MLKYVITIMFVGISFIHADNIQKLDKLEAEKQVLLLKLETYSLQKKIIEMENFIAHNKLRKEKEAAREKALVQFKNDLRSHRNRARLAYIR